MQLSVQLYTLRDALDRDFVGTLESVSEMGLQWVELAGQWRRPDLGETLKSLGLRPSGSHMGLEELEADEGLLDAHAALGIRELTVPWVHPDYWRIDSESLRSRLTAQAHRVAERGFRLSYHNHDFELENNALWPFFESAPELACQFDVAWIHYGGQDPAAYIRRFGDRVASVHLKDTTGDPAQLDCIAGTGNVGWPHVLAACHEVKVPFGVIEMDHPPSDPVADTRACLAFYQAAIRPPNG